jgi:signal transduction histidine kinase
LCGDHSLGAPESEAAPARAVIRMPTSALRPVRSGMALRHRVRKRAHVGQRLAVLVSRGNDECVWVWLPRTLLLPLAKSFALVVAATLILLPLDEYIDGQLVPFAYLIPVVVAATRWGFWPAFAAAVAGTAIADFFFTEPYYSFWIADSKELFELLVFLGVALITSNLAARLKRERDMSHAREQEMRGLYEFSRRLALAFTAADLISAVQDYLTNTLRRRTILVPPPAMMGAALAGEAAAPDHVIQVAIAMMGPGEVERRALTDAKTGKLWLLRRASSETASYGVIAVDLDAAEGESAIHLEQQVETVLAEAMARLRQLDVGHAFSEARLHTQWDVLRQALVGNVSHELRSPLASILGSASVLDRVPAIKQNEHTHALVDTVLQAARRLDEDIRRLLDATRITAGGVCPQRDWVDPVDLIDRALAQKQARLEAHRLAVDIPPDLPLVRVDAALMEQAIGQVLENAAKYSPRGSLITVAVRLEQERIVISITDEGSGLTAAERDQVGRRSFRGERSHKAPAGSGLGPRRGKFRAQAYLGASTASMSSSKPFMSASRAARACGFINGSRSRVAAVSFARRRSELSRQSQRVVDAGWVTGGALRGGQSGHGQAREDRDLRFEEGVNRAIDLCAQTLFELLDVAPDLAAAKSRDSLCCSMKDSLHVCGFPPGHPGGFATT